MYDVSVRLGFSTLGRRL